MEALKNILECIRHKRHIPRDAAETIFDKPLPRATFEVLAAIFNLSLTPSQLQDGEPRTISLLERLAESMGRITQLPKPCSFLANFRKDQFYEYCRSNREYQSLVNKVYGLFPPINLRGGVPLLLEFDAGVAGGDDVGNPHWLLTRSVIEQWLGANRGQMSKEAALSCYILIASPRLLDATEGWRVWDCLWALLYIWLTRHFLSGPLKRAGGRASWCTLEGDQLRKMMVDAGSKVTLPEQRALFKLVLFAVDQLLGEGKESDFLQEAAREYHSLPCQDWQHLLTLHLMKHVANAFLHQRSANQTERLIVDTIQGITTITSLEFQYLLPYLLPENQVRDYIIKRRLEFWNYGLDDEVCEDIAKLYLRDLVPFSEEQRGTILAHLPLEYFVEEILTGLARQKQGKWGKLVVRTLLKSALRQAQILHRYLELSQEECEQELKAFAQQWDTYFTLRLQGIDASNASTCIAFLTFDRTLLSECFQIKARFPQQCQEIYSEVLTLLTTHITAQTNTSLFMSLITDPIFVDYFEQLKEESRDSFWKNWSGLMLQDDSILQTLINIPVE